MAITIQELLASDTISQAVDKINFNFDQLILNGGGPVGPAGPLGPIGPTGNRGIRGSQWFEDPTTSPGTDPNGLIFPDVESGDNYLQANGAVWEYNGTSWIITTINLTGPQGTAGISAGFSYFGGFPGTASINNENVVYPSPMPNGSSGGATTLNEGVPTTMIGAFASNTGPISGIPYTSAYQINDTMAKSIDSSIVSLLVHQKDSGSSGIRFMGGGSIATDKYEQDTLTNLSSISVSTDDKLVIDVPKVPTAPVATVADLIGFEVQTLYKGQNYYSGKGITATTGNDSTLRLPNENSDFSVIVNTTNPSKPGRFEVSTTYTSATAALSVGGQIVFPGTPTKTGRIGLDAGSIQLSAKNKITFNSGDNDYKFEGLDNPTLSPSGIVMANTNGQIKNVGVLGGGGLPKGVVSFDGTSNIDISTGADNRIVRWNASDKLQDSGWVIDDSSVLRPISNSKNIGTAALAVGDMYFSSGGGNIILPYSGSSNNYLNIYSSYSGLRGMQVNAGGVFVNPITGINTKATMQYSDSTLQIAGWGSGNIRSGQLEFKQSNNAVALPGGPRIIGPQALNSTDGRGENDTLTIKGGSGFPGANLYNNGGEGRNVVISGGDATNNASGGTVFIGGGQTSSGTSNTQNGTVWLGRNPYATSGKENSPTIKIGDSGLNTGYITVRHPSDADLSTAGEDFIASFVRNTSTADAGGRIQLRDFDGTSQLNFGVNMTASAYSSNAFYTQEGDSIISADGGVSGGEAGLVILYQNKHGGIRLDGQNEKIMLMGKRNQNLDETAINSNANNATVGVYMEGDIHIDLTNSDQITGVDKDKYILLSGHYVGNSVVSGQGIVNLRMNWTRVGRIVTVQFYVAYNSNNGDRVLPFPIESSGNAGLPSHVFGSGSAYNYSGTSMKPLYVDDSGNGWKLFDQTSGGYSEAGGKAMGTFSYELQ